MPVAIKKYEFFIPYNVKMGCHVIDKNQPIRLAEFGTYGHAIGVPARTTHSKDPDVARDKKDRFYWIYY